MQLSEKPQIFSSPKDAHSLTKVLLHITSAEVESGLNTLDNLQQLLEDYKHRGKEVLIEVVANGEGIKLLQAENTPVAKRISELSRLYENLTFAACSNTIEQMRISKGLIIELIPEVRLIDSGVVQVIERQAQGWTYIRG